MSCRRRRGRIARLEILCVDERVGNSGAGRYAAEIERNIHIVAVRLLDDKGRGRGCPEQDVRRTVQDVGILGLRGDEYEHIAEGEQGLQVGDVRADNLHGNEDAAR